MYPKNQPHINPAQWNSTIAHMPGAHVLQTWEWGKVKSQFGWQPIYLLWFGENDQYKLTINQPYDGGMKALPAAAALALQRNINLGGFSRRIGIIYVPKGPLLDWSNYSLRQRVLQDLKQLGQKNSAIFIKIDPDVEVGIGIPGAGDSFENPNGNEVRNSLHADGWQFSDEQVQFKNTVLIDLNMSEENLLANMKQKTRYNINLAIRKGVNIHSGKLADLNQLYRMYAETSIRDGFVIRNESYYQEVWTTFIRNQDQLAFDQPYAEAMIAEVEGEPVAGAIIFSFASKAWYLYGMSRLAHREKMPNYLIQWEAIRRSKAAGCASYDLWGAPDEFVETDPLWGVYRFKEGLGGTVHRYLGAWDYPINRMLYRLYSKTLPGLLDIMRAHGNTSTRQVIG
jgi:lipid II:glycine glycyltransferase (peptidoglycan interpeptide bridge formation enzyme)